MKVVGPEQFLDMPPGTVFAFGPAYAFSDLMVKEDSIRGDGCWGFWAMNPCGIEADDCSENFDRLSDMQENGASYPMSTSVSKYMSYDGDDMSSFLVFEEADLERLKAIMGNGSWD